MDIIDTILNVIANHNSFVISTHVKPDGDALGSQFGLYSFLKDLGKHVWVVNDEPVPAMYSFFPFSDIVLQKPPAEQFEILIVTDAGSLKRIGERLEKSLIPQKAIINIDHHKTNDRFGHYNFVLPGVASTSELIYKIIKRLHPDEARRHPSYGDETRRLASCGDKTRRLSACGKIGLEGAICLYTGIMTDTGGFRYSNTTPETHCIAADLISEGVPYDKIYEYVYEATSANRIRLLSLALNTLQLTDDGRIGWIYITQDMYALTGTIKDDTENFINYVRYIDTVDVAVLYREMEDHKTKVSFRSRDSIDVSKIAEAFGGGGHRNAAGCTLEMPMDEAKTIMMPAIRQILF